MSVQQPEIWKEKLLEALEQSLGIVTPACKAVGISRDRFYEYCKTDSEFKRKVDDINEVTVDFVENQLLKAIKDGDAKAIMFFMKYKGRKRGYTNTLDIEGNLNHIVDTVKLIEIKKDDGQHN